MPGIKPCAASGNQRRAHHNWKTMELLPSETLIMNNCFQVFLSSQAQIFCAFSRHQHMDNRTLLYQMILYIQINYTPFKSSLGGKKNPKTKKQNMATCFLPTNSRHVGKSHIAGVMDNSDIKCGFHGRFIKTWVNRPGIRWFQLGGNQHTVLQIRV